MDFGNGLSIGPQWPDRITLSKVVRGGSVKVGGGGVSNIASYTVPALKKAFVVPSGGTLYRTVAGAPEGLQVLTLAITPSGGALVESQWYKGLMGNVVGNHLEFVGRDGIFLSAGDIIAIRGDSQDSAVGRVEYDFGFLVNEFTT